MAGSTAVSHQIPCSIEEFVQKQVDHYDPIRYSYQVFREILQAVLQKAVKNLGISAIVESRAKEIASFAGKAVRKRDKYPDPVSQFTDLCGARVITQYKDEIEPVCRFIRAHFEIDEANSEDVVTRLGVSEFGYRSVHFIVSLKPGKFKDIIHSLENSKSEGCDRDRFRNATSCLYDRRSNEKCTEGGAAPGPKFKAEIQVRTLLQHAWALFAHDRIYKSDFKVPEVLQREANRIAATLEEIDDAFARTINAVENYKTYYGAYMKREQRESEIKKLMAAFRHDKGNMSAARQIARLALSVQDWKLAESILSEFVEKWQNSPCEWQNYLLKGFSATRLSIFQWALRALRLGERRIDSEKNDLKAILSKEVERQKKEDKEKSAEIKTLNFQDIAEMGRIELEHLHDTEMAGVLLDYGKAKWRQNNNQEGRKMIEQAVTLDPVNTDALVSLAGTYADEDNARIALEYYEKALNLAQSDPRTLRGFLFCKILLERSVDFISILRSTLERAIEECRKRARVGVYLPQAYYDIGLFSLLLDRPYESMTAFSKALHLSDSAVLAGRALDRIRKIRGELKNPPNEYQWIERFLCIGKVAKALQCAAAYENDVEKKKILTLDLEHRLEAVSEEPEQKERLIREGKDALREYEKAQLKADTARKDAESIRLELLEEIKSHDIENFREPVVIVSGGTDMSVEEIIREYRTMLETAFEGFNGIIFSGGTTAGICGLIGDLRCSADKVAYLPKTIPSWAEKHKAYRIVSTEGADFSILEPIQNWIDILASGIDPATVKLIGINGGRISAVEYRLALAMGARVGIIQNSGRAASDLLKDEEWIGTSGLLMMPGDPQTLKVFLKRPQPSDELKTCRDGLARRAHEVHQKEKKKNSLKKDPSTADWELLLPDLKQSNLQQVDYMEEKLRAVGLGVRKASKDKITLYTFTEEQIETMAEIEHARWIVERLTAGWTPGEKDVEKKKTPYLVPYSELADEIKEYDRITIKSMPGMLKEVGLEIVPI